MTTRPPSLNRSLRRAALALACVLAGCASKPPAPPADGAEPPTPGITPLTVEQDEAVR